MDMWKKSVERFRASAVEESASEGDMAVGDAGTASSGTEAGVHLLKIILRLM